MYSSDTFYYNFVSALNVHVARHNAMSPMTDEFIIPYSGLFSLGANFPKFSEWARDSGKFMLG